MKLRYSVSLWNFCFPMYVPDLERIVTALRQNGYGIELINAYREEHDLYNKRSCKRLKHIVLDMAVSLHSAKGSCIDLHTRQIDAAADVGAEVVVIHPQNLITGGGNTIDVQLCRDVVAHAGEHGVRLALENVMVDDEISMLAWAAESVDGLGICLDVGHVYSTPDPLRDYLDALKHRIIHLHLHDIVLDCERAVDRVGGEFFDHCTPGTGSIPPADWELLMGTLQEIDFNGMAVFEDIPRNPLQNAAIARSFLQDLRWPTGMSRSGCRGTNEHE